MGKFYETHRKEFDDLEENKKYRELRILSKQGIIEGDEGDQAICWNYMAKDYYYGRGGGNNDYALAFKVFRRNADLDNRYWYMAVKHVGIMYALGEGVKQDVNEALRYLKVYADWMEKDDCWDEFVTYYYGLLARRAYKENNHEEVDKYMQKIKYASDKFSNSLCSFHYGTYLLQGVPFPYELYNGENANGKDPVEGYKYLLKSYNDGYRAAELAAFQIFLLHSYGCPKAKFKVDDELAGNALNFANARSFYPARSIKSNQYEIDRAKLYTYKETTTTYWSDGTTTKTSRYVKRSKYCGVDDTLNTLDNQMAILRIHEHERFLLWIHDYAPIELHKYNGTLERRYPKVEGAISRWPGYKVYSETPAKPIFNINYDEIEIPSPYDKEPEPPTTKETMKGLFKNGLKRLFFGRK